MYDLEASCNKLIRNIKDVLSEKRMSINSLAQKSGISPSTLSEMFNYKTKPQVYTLFRLCNALEVPMERLLQEISYNDFLEDTFMEEKIDMHAMETLKERQMMADYRRLSKKDRELLELYIEMLKIYEKYK